MIVTDEKTINAFTNPTEETDLAMDATYVEAWAAFKAGIAEMDPPDDVKDACENAGDHISALYEVGKHFAPTSEHTEYLGLLLAVASELVLALYREHGQVVVLHTTHDNQTVH